jgi:hypothetical protein
MTPRIVIENLEECFDQDDFYHVPTQSTRNNRVTEHKDNTNDNIDNINKNCDNDNNNDDAKRDESRRHRDHPFPLVPPSMKVSTTSSHPLHLQQQPQPQQQKQLFYNRPDKLSHNVATLYPSRHHHHDRYSKNVVAQVREDRLEQEQRRKCRRRDRMVASGWVGLVIGLIVIGGPIGLVGSVVGATVALGVTKVGERRKDARVAKASSLVGTARETL